MLKRETNTITKLLATFVLNFIYICCQSQMTFQKTYGGTDDDYGSCVNQTADGGYIIAGSTWSYGPGLESVYLIKTNSIGDTLWTRIFGGPVSSGGIQTVEETTDGGYIIASATKSFGAGNQDFYLIKTDLNGIIQWTKTFGGANVDIAYSIQQTTDGGYIILGSTFSYGAGNADLYLVKTNSIGDFLWRKTYGGTNSDFGNCIQQTTDGGYIITGRTNSFGTGDFDAYLIKTNSLGDTLWSKTYGGANFDNAYFVLQDTSGYIISGGTNSFGAGLQDAYLLKTDTIGNLIWSKTYGGTNTDFSTCIKKTTDGGYIVSGYTQSFGGGNYDAYLIKTDLFGDTLWTKTFGGAYADIGFSVSQTIDEGYIVTGYMQNMAGFEDVYLIKTDSVGNSDCYNQYKTNTQIGIPTTTISSMVMQVLSSADIGGTTTTIVSQGATLNNPCLTVGLSEMTGNVINNISPNPFSTATNFKVEKYLTDATLIAYNSLGEIIKTIKNISGQVFTFQRDNLPIGVYLIRLTQDNKIIATEKLFVID